jgi:hypothetical protein
VIAIAIGIFLFVLQVFPIGNDYFYWYRPIAEQWLNGDRTLYDGPNQRLFYPPWTLFVILPLGPPSLVVGSALLNTLSLLCLLLALMLHRSLVRVTLLGLLLALLNLHTVDLFILGQLDFIGLGGILLAWWGAARRRPLWLGLGLCMMSMKPVNMILPGILLLIAMRGWSWREVIQAFLPLVVMVLVSSALVGFDWPLKYAANFVDPVSRLAISIWRGAEALGLPGWLPAPFALIAALAFLRVAWRDGLTERTLALAVTTNLAFSMYAHGHYYVALLPAMIAIARHNRWVALLAYLATWAPLLRSPFGVEASWVGVLYPVILLTALWWVVPNHAHQTTPPA